MFYFSYPQVKYKYSSFKHYFDFFLALFDDTVLTTEFMYNAEWHSKLTFNEQ